MVSAPDFIHMTADGYFPSSSGVRMGMTSGLQGSAFRPVTLFNINLAVLGTVGTGSPSFQVEAQDVRGDWAPCPNLKLTSKGAVCGYAEGVAFRVNAARGTTPGTGANIPRYHLDISPAGLSSTGDK